MSASRDVPGDKDTPRSQDPLAVEDNGMCFCCGPLNPIGLKLEFEMTGERSMRTYWTPRPEHQGFANIVHGGLVTTVLDEVMIRLLYALGIPAVTAELTARLLQPIRAGSRYVFEARIAEERGRVVTTESEASRADTGDRVAWARARCVRTKT